MVMCLDLVFVTVLVLAQSLLLLPLLPLLFLLYLAFLDLHASSPTSNASMYTIVALSYRGFRTSHSHPSGRGIAVDTAASLNWVSQRFPQDLKPVLWGQSLGAVVAPNVVASQIQSRPSRQLESAVNLREETEGLKVDDLVLETLFTSIRAMPIAIYPQQWLPYRYLYPFLVEPLGQQTSLLCIAKSKAKPTILILPPSNDELVPKPHGAELEEVCKGGGMDVRHVVVKASLHHEILSKPKGQQAVVGFLKNIAEKG